MALSLTDNSLPEKTFEFDLSSTRPAFTFKPDSIEISGLEAGMPDLSNLELDTTLGSMTAYAPDTKDPTANILADFMGTAKAKAQKNLFEGAVLKTLTAASSAFDSAINFKYRKDIINLQSRNTKIAADNQMKAIDNQVLYTKNQIMDRFTTMVANNTVQMAAKNLRVTAGNLLEGTKSAAYDITQDFATLDSNARMKKLELESVKEQASIAKKLAHTQNWTNLISSVAKLGLAVGTGGGTGESWGDLYAGYKEGKEWLSGSLNDIY